jgi:hypothetical protein
METLNGVIKQALLLRLVQWYLVLACTKDSVLLRLKEREREANIERESGRERERRVLTWNAGRIQLAKTNCGKAFL